jgi:hypothetical protein
MARPPGKVIELALPFWSNLTGNAHSPKTPPAGIVPEVEKLIGGVPPVWASAGGNTKMHEMAETTEATTNDALRMGLSFM